MTDSSMESREHHLTFGPVPSRRLGQSLGINNVTAKSCSYTCIYCQIGETTEKIITPRRFFTPQQIHDAVVERLGQAEAAGVAADYLTFVPDGEPTLDQNLGEAIRALRPLKLPIAVISNATLLMRAEVRAALSQADLVSLKVDTIDEALWRRINLPHRDLQLEAILEGISRFAAEYRGRLISDSMLIAGLNDGDAALTATAEFIAGLNPECAYLAIPTRPPTVAGVHGVDEAGLLRAHRIFSSRLPRVELLAGHEVGAFAYSGNARDDLLAITAVHPMREADVRRLLENNGVGWEVVEAMVAAGELKQLAFEGESFLLRPVRCGRQRH